MADSFVPPESVRSAARRGLDLRKKWGRGGLSNAEASEQGIGSGVQRATNLANGDAVNLDTIQRMANFFSRHEKNRGIGEKENDGGPTAGYIAWQLWGGDAGKTWANRILREQDSMKAGNRNNRSDRQRIRAIRQQAQGIVATTLELEPSASDEPTPPADMMVDVAKATQIDPNAHPGAMVALMLSPEQQAQIAAYRVGDMANSEADHVTLLYLADDAELLTGFKNKIIEELAQIASMCSAVGGKLNGYGRFSGNGEMYPVYANYDSSQLFKVRSKLLWKLTELGVELPEDHGFTPHLTLGYLPTSEVMPALDMPDLAMTFDSLSLIWAGERIDMMFFGDDEDYEDDGHEDLGGMAVTVQVSGAAKGFDLDTATESQPLIIGMVRAIKSDGEWALEVLGVPFGGPNGGKDSDEEYFSRRTNIYAEKYATPPAVYYHGYDENGHPSSEPQFIGTAKYDRIDDKGHWYKVILDKTSDYAKRVWNAAKQGFARASSGSITHLVRKERDGHITHWPVAELSIFDAVGKRQPANQYAVALPVLKSVYAQAGLTLPDDIFTDSAQAPEDAAIGGDRTSSQGRASAKATETEQQDNNRSTGVFDMSDVNIQELVAQSVDAAFAQRDAAAKAEADRQAEVANAAKSAADAAVKATREAMQAELDAAKAEAEAAKAAAAEARRLPGGGAHAAKFEVKYDGLSIEDLAFMSGVLNSAKGMRIDGRESSGTTEGLRRALAIRLLDSSEGKADEYRAAKSAMPDAVKSMKANELNYSTLSSYGDDWIGVTYSTQLWDKIRLQTQIVSRIPTVIVPQGSESIVIPVNTTSPTFYKVAQATAQDANPGRVTPTVTTSRMGTTNKTLTVSKLGAAVNYSGELEEDSLIPWVAELRRDLIAEGAEVLEHVVIDGDTATGATTNINDIGGTPAGNEAFLLFDGFRKLALVTNTANSRSAGTLTIEDYLETIKLMGLGGKNAVDKSRVAFILDMFTHWKSLELAELKTQDVYSMPTIEEGVLRRIYGHDVLVTNNMHRANQDATYGLKANPSGKVDLDTASNNTTGSILAVRWDQWRLGYKRNWTFEVQRDAISDSTVIVGMMRVGMVYRDTEASAVSYNVTL